MVTVTTVGFGDLSPETVGSKVFTIFYAPLGVVMFASAINTVSYIPLRYRKIKLEKYASDNVPYRAVGLAAALCARALRPAYHHLEYFLT